MLRRVVLLIAFLTFASASENHELYSSLADGFFAEKSHAFVDDCLNEAGLEPKALKDIVDKVDEDEPNFSEPEKKAFRCILTKTMATNDIVDCDKVFDLFKVEMSECTDRKDGLQECFNIGLTDGDLHELVVCAAKVLK